MIWDSIGKYWIVDLDQLPPAFVEGRERLERIGDPRDLCGEHLYFQAVQHLRAQGEQFDFDVAQGIPKALALKEDPDFSFRIAREQEEGMYGEELRHARILIIANTKARRRAEAAQRRGVEDGQRTS